MRQGSFFRSIWTVLGRKLGNFSFHDGNGNDNDKKKSTNLIGWTRKNKPAARVARTLE